MKFLVVYTILLMLSTTPGWAKNKSISPDDNKAINTTRWLLPAEYGPEQFIGVQVIQDPFWKYHLEFSHNNSTQTIRAVPPFLEAFGLRIRDVLVLDDQNLATLWKTATGDLWDLKVYTYSKRNVLEVLHATSQYRPEFVYLEGTEFKSQPTVVPDLEAGHPNLVINKTKRLVQCIVVSQAKRIDGKWVPTSCDISCWDEKNKRYIKHSNVSWKNRLQWNPNSSTIE